MPANVFPDHPFPVSQTVINEWIDKGNDSDIYAHGWTLWAGLTSDSGSTARGVENAPIYLTWATPDQLAHAPTAGENLVARNEPLRLQPPRQFHSGHPRVTAPQAIGDARCGGSGKPDTCIVVTVNYSPSAAHHVLSNDLLAQSTLARYVEEGYSEIPNLPYDAVTVKPVYKVISQEKLDDNGLYAMPVWPGTPEPAKTFGEEVWNQCVHIDPNNQGQGDGSVDQGCTGASPSTTYNLSDFIHYPVTKADQAYLQNLSGGQEGTLEVGDTIILVAMHVGSREIKRWTWQTFWWTADPEAPNAPSSQAMAAAQPEQLPAPASHYAMSAAYQMLAPAQPLNDGENYGALLPVYNPYLEAGFDPQTFKLSRPVIVPDSGLTATRYGVETNCMTCHGLAAYDPAAIYDDTGLNRETPYAANFYLPLNDRVFDGKLKLDFAWSILGAMDQSR
ncbi:hypothetical protein CKO21_12035 [Rhodovibrio salinarum]|uniref:Uncharacterized protein n=1 Tax=Rhodovibrio salinarum TaxID=1087 RepID=A0A934QJD2_9PROT|nr:hypothetical protein [Rhodovibrio salinarum]